MTPKALICWYYDKRDALGVKGFNPIDSVGRWYFKTCRSKKQGKVCGYRKRSLRLDGTWFCGKCGSAWKFSDRFMFKGEVQLTPHSDTVNAADNRHIDVGMVLHGLLNDEKWRWDMMIYVASCQGHSIGNNALARKFREEYPEVPGPWSRPTLFRRAARARDEWVRRLELSGVKTT